MKSAVCVLLCLVACGSLLAQTPSIKTGTVEQIKVHGKSLEGNLEGDSPDRDVFVYLPPGYGTNTNLKKYRAIMMDVGLQDNLAGSNRQLNESLKTFSINHTFETYEGDRNNRVPERIEQKVLPFFSNNLSF